VSLAASPRRNETRIDTAWSSDLERARYWAMAAKALAEQALEELPAWSLERLCFTALLRTIRSGGAGLVHEYRSWQRRDPQLCAAMVHAGRRHDARQQVKLATWLMEGWRETA